jgi:hypothetical protein
MQPKAPGGACQPIPDTSPPKLEPVLPCPKPDPACWCPEPPKTAPSCLEDLITAQTTAIAAADKAKQFRDELQKLLDKAKAAKQEYTPDKHRKLVEEWVKQDGQIAELVRRLVCAVPCWRCILECYVCPLLNEVRDAQQRLWGGPGYGAITNVGNWNEMRAWRQRDLDVKEQRLQRIVKVLGVWEKPAATIEKVLLDNTKMIDEGCKTLGQDAAKLVFDVFIKLVPRHLSIAPPASDGKTTSIDVEYTEFCACDEGKPDDCCGPDVGEWSLRQRLIGPQPYLIDPNAYFALICCLVEHRLGPAQEAAVKARGELQKVEDQIKRDQTLLEGWAASFEKDARTAIPSATACRCGHESEQIELPKNPAI